MTVDSYQEDERWKTLERTESSPDQKTVNAKPCERQQHRHQIPNEEVVVADALVLSLGNSRAYLECSERTSTVDIVMVMPTIRTSLSSEPFATENHENEAVG
jgi:hypothetical protein